MSAIKREAQETAREMRLQGQSVNEIAKTLNVSKSSVSVWVRDVEITSEQKKILSENSRANAIHLQKGGPDGKPFSEVNRQNGIQRRLLYQQAGREQARLGNPLHRMGCILYWAEGAKERNRLVFVNSDPNMMSLFMRFLRASFPLRDEYLRLRLHCHTTDSTEQERMKRYWLDLLHIDYDCFNKVIALKGGHSSLNRHPNGLCTICISNNEVVMHIFGAIQEYTGINKPEWLFENGVRGSDA